MKDFGFFLLMLALLGAFYAVAFHPAAPTRRAAPPPPFRMPPMSSAARIVMRHMVAGKAIRARTIASACGIPVSGVLAAQRELRSIGLAVYGPAANDNGRIAGSGYCLTETGREVQRRLADAA